GDSCTDQIQCAEPNPCKSVSGREVEASEWKDTGCQPTVQILAGRTATNERLPQMIMRIHKPRQDDLAGRVHHLRTNTIQVSTYLLNLISFKHEVGILEYSQFACAHRGIHGEDQRRVTNQRPSVIRQGLETLETTQIAQDDGNDKDATP